MSTIKTFGTVAIMIACFAVIYPRFMHPLVLRAFGLHESSKKDGEGPMYPPSYKSMHPERHKKGTPDVDEMKKHMRAGPHPGMRAAAEMQRQQAQQGSGRGMMGVVLPMYAIGIVLYLVYTLFKVFNKSKTNTWQRGQYGRGGRGTGQDRMGFPMDCDGSGDVRNFLNDQDQRKELEDLLTRVDDKNVSTEEMRVLQKRLEETEAQMTRILQAMQSVQSNVDKISAEENIGVPQSRPNETSEGMPSKQASKESNETEVKQQTKDGKENPDSKKKPHDEKATQESSNAERRKEASGDQKRNIDLDGIDKDTDEENENDGEENENDAEENDNEGNENEATEEVVENQESNVGEDLQSSVRQRKVKNENEQ